MLSRLAAALTATSAVAFAPPAANADPPTYACTVAAVQHDVITGQPFQGILAGFVSHAHNASLWVRCWITVNGVRQAATDVGYGTTVATAQRDVSFTAGDTDVVRICIEFDGPPTTACRTVGFTEVPPPTAGDAVEETVDRVRPVTDPTVCSPLRWLAGSYGVADVNYEGDVYVNGEPYYDCPPYGSVEPFPSREQVGDVTIVHGSVSSVVLAQPPAA
ncbi:MAG TPA: hypothetical protein VNA20_03075 [Frankiaceae bacterium]|nr:hypothetical protein [Frankiaceae bacterium]